MNLSLFHALNSSPNEYIKEHDFSTVNDAATCDEITSESKASISKLRMTAIIAIVIAVTSFYFCFLGVAAFFAPSGVFAAETSIIASAKVIGCLALSAAPHYDFLEVTLPTIHSLIVRNNNKIQLSEQRKLELLKPTTQN